MHRSKAKSRFCAVIRLPGLENDDVVSFRAQSFCFATDQIVANVSQTENVMSGANSESFFGPIAIFAT
jgi:NMD protein affecting ribosome stability and mRNA decay